MLVDQFLLTSIGFWQHNGYRGHPPIDVALL